MRRFLLACLFSAAAIGSTTGGYWVQDRDLPVQVEFKEIVGPTRPGGKLRVRWQVYRDRLCATTKQEIIIDMGNSRWVLPAQFSPQPLGGLGFDAFISQTDLPPDIPPGDASLRVVLSYVCNPLHMAWPVVNRLPPIRFRIDQ